MSPKDIALRPMIPIRGFGGPDITGVQGSPYQGYNDGTVYPGKRGGNYIYEGFLLRALKSDGYPYSDATQQAVRRRAGQLKTTALPVTD